MTTDASGKREQEDSVPRKREEDSDPREGSDSSESAANCLCGRSPRSKGGLLPEVDTISDAVQDTQCRRQA